MAKRSAGPNKSAAIREYLDANPAAKPREIVDALKSQGVSVSPAFVSTIKSKAGAEGSTVTKRRGRPKGSGRKSVTRKQAAGKAVSPAPATRRGATTETITVDGLVAAKKLVDLLGGHAKARAALSALEKITG